MLNPVKIDKSKLEAGKRLRDEVASLKEAIKFFERQLGIAILERDDYRTAMDNLYMAVAEAPESVEPAMRLVRRVAMHVVETGVTPTVYLQPELRKQSVLNWEAMHENVKRQIGTKEDVIFRVIQCKHCGLRVQTALPLSTDAFSCPSCKQMVKI